MQLSTAFHDPELCRGLLDRLQAELKQELAFMEVCGTHTVTIFQSGLRTMLPPRLKHVSGPGCPVCVTHAGEIQACLEVAGKDKVMVATFGDMLRVPGPDGRTLKQAQAEGADVAVCYSPMDAVRLAQKHPEREVVFLGVGFETTAPAVAAAVQQARRLGLANFSLVSCHKRIPPALRHLLGSGDVQVEAFILPGHVSTVIGIEPYAFLPEEFGLPAVVAGFEPAEILQALLEIVRMLNADRPEVLNAYPRGVAEQGNPKAKQVMAEVFQVTEATWRGLGRIADSGFGLSAEYADFDAADRFHLQTAPVDDPPGCLCGQVLKGTAAPSECRLFGSACTPASPVGPCMVSSEGSCAAHFKYSLDRT